MCATSDIHCHLRMKIRASSISFSFAHISICQFCPAWIAIELADIHPLTILRMYLLKNEL